MNTTMTPLHAMPLRLKKITLWRREINTQPGALANAIAPLANAGIDLQVVLRYRHPTDKNRAFVEVCPQSVDSDEAVRADLQAAGFKARHVPALLIDGEHLPGYGYRLAQVMAGLGVNIMFMATQATNGKYAATIGFETDADAEKAVGALLLTTTPQATDAAHAAELDIDAIATVHVTSEEPDHPITNVFDRSRGPGGSRWVAREPGEQSLVLTFHTPQTIRQIDLEVEEQEVSRSQELWLCVSYNNGHTYQNLLRQEYNFSPPGTTFEGEQWLVTAREVTHLRLRVKPDKNGQPCRATVTSLILH